MLMVAIIIICVAVNAMAGYLLFLLQQGGNKGLVKGPVQVMNHQDVLLKSASIQHN